ncbi:MAG: methylmalonyl-CoA mutase family protein [bacterium]
MKEKSETPDLYDRKHSEEPGKFPFTRGIHRSMYQHRYWTMRQYAGFGTAEETNRRYHYLLNEGTSGLSVAFDLPTQMGLDSDHPLANGEVGRVGVAIDSLEDMRRLFSGISLDEVSTSMTINSTAAILLAMYISLADEQGVSRESLAGTVQNDILKEYVARGTYIYPMEESLRLVSDLTVFCSDELPGWNPISISGYHIREAGSTAAQEIAFTLANGLEYVERLLAGGMNLETFAPRLSFFFAAHNDIFEEVAKFRAARRLWAQTMKSKYGASDRSCWLRFHTQTGGSTLTAQQPMNNAARVTIQAMAAVLGGTQSLHTNGFDEALNLPTTGSAKLALRTQQIIAYESGIAKVTDPMAGSYYIEELTDKMVEMSRDYLDKIDALGGASNATVFMQEEIAAAAYSHQKNVEKGKQVIVGVNQFVEEEEEHSSTVPADYLELEGDQCHSLINMKARRDKEKIKKACDDVRLAVKSGENLIPVFIDAVKTDVTLGEISEILRVEWGEYQA